MNLRSLRARATWMISLVLVLALSFANLPAAKAVDTLDPNWEQASAYGRAVALGVGSTLGDKTANDIIVLGVADRQRAAATPDGEKIDDGPNLLSLVDNKFIDLGGGITIPLLKTNEQPGLLDLGTGGVGLLSGYTKSTSKYDVVAGTGVAGADGAIDLDFNRDKGYMPVTLDVTELFRQLKLSVLTDALIDKVALELGVGGSNAHLTVDPDTGLQKVQSNYALADAKLKVSAPILKVVRTILLGGKGPGIDGDDTTYPGVIGIVDGALKVVLGTVKVLLEAATFGTLSLDIGLNLQDPLEEFLGTPLTNDSYEYTWEDGDGKHTETVPGGIVSIDIGQGIITVDLEKLHAGEGYGGAQGLNGLPPNTTLLDEHEVGKIVDAVTRLLVPVGVQDFQDLVREDPSPSDPDYEAKHAAYVAYSKTLIGKLDALLNNLMSSLKVNLVSTSPVTGAKTTLLGGTLKGYADYNACRVTSGIFNTCEASDYGVEYSGLITGLLGSVLGVVGGLLDNILGLLSEGVLNPVLTYVVKPLVKALEPLFNAVNAVLTLRVNRQWVRPNEDSAYATGTLHDDSDGISPAYNGEGFSVAALEIGIGNGSQDGDKKSLVAVTLGESTVRATPYETKVSANCGTVDLGGTPTDCVTLTGTGLGAFLKKEDGSYASKAITPKSLTFNGVSVNLDTVTAEVIPGTTPQQVQVVFPKPTKPDTGWPAEDGGIEIQYDTSSRPFETTFFTTEKISLVDESTKHPLHYDPVTELVQQGSTVDVSANPTQESRIAGSTYAPIVPLEYLPAFIEQFFDKKWNTTSLYNEIDALSGVNDDSSWETLLGQVEYLDEAPEEFRNLPGSKRGEVLRFLMTGLAGYKDEMSDSKELSDVIPSSGVIWDPATGTVTAQGLSAGDIRLIPMIRIDYPCTGSYGVSVGIADIRALPINEGTLPLTGGNGVAPFALLSLLTAAGAIFLAVRRRVQA